MEQLICIRDNNRGERVVSARELHTFLEVGKDFSTWIKQRIERYEFIENQDFEVFTQMGENPNGGRNRIEYALNINMAKELAMLEGNEKGKAARRYFISCERIAKNRFNMPSPKELAMMVLKAEEEKEALEAQNKALSKRANYTEKVLASTSTHTITTIANELGLTATKLNKLLCERGVQYKHRDYFVLTAKYLNRGYTSTRTFHYSLRDGTQKTKIQTEWTETGRAFIHSLLNESLSSISVVQK